MTTFPGDPNDVLTRLTGALAAQPIPTGPDASLKQDLIATLERQSKRSIAPRDRNLRSGWTMQRVLKIAAAFLMIVGVSGFVMTRSSGSGSVFAAMIDRVNEIRTARFNMRSNMKLDDGPTTIDSTITLASPWTRVDANMDGLKATKITNSEQHKTLMLFEHSKTAKLSDNTGAPQKLQQNDVVARLRSLPKEGAEDLGSEQINGVEARKFRYQQKGDFYTIWVDPASKLPIELRLTDKLDSSEATVDVTFSGFEWNMPFDSLGLSLEPPAGYEMSTN